MLSNTSTQQKSAIFAMILVVFSPLGIDLYLASFIKMSSFFEHDMEVTLSIYLFFLGMGQILWGWISDRLGRRPVALTGLLIYSISSILLFSCQHFETLLCLRALQGLGAAAITLTAFVTIRDCFEKQESARYFSLLNASLNVVSSLAPILGSLILTYFSWRANFAFLCGFSLLILVIVYWYMPESLAQKSQSRLPPLFELLKYKSFIVYGIICGFALSLILSHVALSPSILIEKGHVTPTQFSLLFGSNAFLIIVANVMNNKILKKVSSQHVLKIGLILMAISGILMLSFYESNHILAYMVPIYLLSIGYAFMMGPSNALALSEITSNFGSATAVIGAFQMAISGIVSALFGLVQDDVKFYYGMSIVLFVMASLIGIKFLKQPLPFQRAVADA